MAIDILEEIEQELREKPELKPFFGSESGQKFRVISGKRSEFVTNYETGGFYFTVAENEQRTREQLVSAMADRLENVDICQG